MTGQSNVSTTSSVRPLTTLGIGGPLVSPMGLGTMTYGAETDEKMAHLLLDTYVESGGTFIDTADV